MDETIRGLTGPDLSAAVALAMGWQRGNDIDGNDIWVPPDGSALSVDRWQPHADHNDLHRVIEWMRGQGWWWDFALVACRNDPANVKAAFYRGMEVGYSWSDTINTAVLRACLLAVRWVP